MINCPRRYSASLTRVPDVQRAILWQNGSMALNAGQTDAKELINVMHTFLGYRLQVHTPFGRRLPSTSNARWWTEGKG